MMRKLARQMQAAFAVKERPADPLPVMPLQDRSRPVETDLDDRMRPVRIGRDRSEVLPPISPRRRPDAGICVFVEHLQSHGLIGEFGWRPLPGNPRRDGIYKFYLDHCEAERTTPLPPHTFQRWLAKHPAVERYQVQAGPSELTAYFIHDSADRYWINYEGERDAKRPPH